MDSTQGSDGLDFLDPLPRDEPSPLRERLETSLQARAMPSELLQSKKPAGSPGDTFGDTLYRTQLLFIASFCN